MSSGSHLSKDIYELIKAIGETRSKVNLILYIQFLFTQFKP